jgi:hypothetical protein
MHVTVSKALCIKKGVRIGEKNGKSEGDTQGIVQRN